MTQGEYDGYRQRFEAGMAKYGLTHLCDDGEESHFSWSPCDVCGDTSGGQRHTCLGTLFGAVSACDGCIYYAEYGRLDDTTMLGLSD